MSDLGVRVGAGYWPASRVMGPPVVNLDRVVGPETLHLLETIVSRSLASGGTGIDSTSGTLSHGSTVTISGSGFGSKSTAAPTIWDDCQGTTITTLWSGGLPNAAGDSTRNLAYSTPIRSQALPYSGNGATKYMRGGHENTSFYGGWNVMPWKTRTVSLPADTYMCLYYREDASFNHTNNDKMFDYSRGGEPYNLTSSEGANWYAEYKIDAGFGWHLNDDKTTSPRNLDEGQDWYGDSGGSAVGTWRKLEFFIRYASNGAGRITIIQDGTTLLSYAGSTDNMPSNDRSEGVGGYTDNYNTNNWRYFKDIYYDRTWAHVLLGNASTLAACTVREPQIPSAWNNTSITITMNHASFSAGQTRYLYVCDATGAYSSGFSVTLA